MPKKTGFFCAFSCLFLFNLGFSCLFFPSRTQAKTYTTSLLNLDNQPIEALSWTFTPYQASASATFQVNISYPQIESTTPSWTSLNQFATCQKQPTKILCQLPLSSISASPFKLQFQYEENFDFNLNFQLVPDFSENLDSTQQTVTYSPLKNLTPNLLPTQLSWQESSLDEFNQIDTSHKNLLLQYRSATDEAQPWSSWQGNFNLIDQSSPLSIDGTTSALLIPSLALSPNQQNFLHLRYLNFQPQADFFLTYSEANQEATQIAVLAAPLQLSQPAAIGNQETDAFANTSFYLVNNSSLHLGQEIILQENINGTLHQVQGTITDLKASTGLVTVNAWTGVIPLQNHQQCQGQTFCFSSAAQVLTIDDLFLPLTHPQASAIKNPTLTSENQAPLKIKVLSLSSNAITTPICLESQNEFCTLSALNLDFVVPPKLMQYRLINFYLDTLSLENIFLHQEPFSVPLSNSDSTSSHINYLRHGKSSDASGIAKPYFW